LSGGPGWLNKLNLELQVDPKELPKVHHLSQSKTETIAIESDKRDKGIWFARFRRKNIVVSKTVEQVTCNNGSLFARFHANGHMNKTISSLG
jgi:hypothetical protein